MLLLDNIIHMTRHEPSSPITPVNKTFTSTIDTKGLKIITNVTTRWLSLLEPIKRIMTEFRTVLGKMEVDASNKKEKVISKQFGCCLLVCQSSFFFLFIFYFSCSVKLLSSFPFSSILYSLCLSFLFRVHRLQISKHLIRSLDHLPIAVKVISIFFYS
jgi:hypothetical protein